MSHTGFWPYFIQGRGSRGLRVNRQMSHMYLWRRLFSRESDSRSTNVRPSVRHQNPQTALNHSYHLTTTFTTTHTITHNITHNITTEHHHKTSHTTSPYYITTQHHLTTSPHNITMHHHHTSSPHNITTHDHNHHPHHHPLHLLLERLLSFSACFWRFVFS